MGGLTNLDAVLMTNVPEPFSLNDDGNNVKPDGIPEGLSDRVVERGDRWVMENRIELSENRDGGSH